ncbi:dethiobiotin synthase [Rubritalea profundi]|uniref:ATP-dependent dethiobiotin synthetase BioD n=1 Tax=Rubritalea profundi TaxID=1658618 RepID=A0A2S7U4L8_9BACT|nr:dethiobiotin synthase [Rubritalea profundi]PQJ29959.1 dethiobiotin synthase [Rubritalea profundi]
MSKGLFITGTDTDCGKTYVTSLIIRALRAERVDAVGYKPICCGDRNDAIELVDASDNMVTADQVNPLWLKTPAAPHVAAMFENAPIDSKVLLQGRADLGVSHQVVITEGVGGLLVPIAGKDFSVAELAKEVGDPVLLVVGNKLGALNHTLLTVEAMRSRGIEPAGLIFNNLVEELDTATITNKGIVEDMCGVEVITDVIRGQSEIEAWPFLELLGL